MEIIIGETSGFCGGITNAVNKTIEFAKNKNGETTYCLGDLAHNPVVMKQLKDLGVKVISDLSEVEKPNGKQVIIRAHGVTKSIYEQAKKLGIELIDLTCPKVLNIHKIAEEYSKNGYYIIFIGEKGHPEVIGTESFCGTEYKTVENEQELNEVLSNIKSDKILVIAQTTFNLEKFNKFCNTVQEKFPEAIIKNTVCNATRRRQQETQELATKVEYMIIIGGKKSSNTNKLYNIACEKCKNAIMIEGAEELTQEQLQEIHKYNKIGIMAGASTPQQSIYKVKEKLEM